MHRLPKDNLLDVPDYASVMVPSTFREKFRARGGGGSEGPLVITPARGPMPEGPDRIRCVDWVFTIWPQDDCDFDVILGNVNEWPFKYITYQIEVGDDNLPHVQGFVQFREKQRLSALKKLFPTWTEWAKRRGTFYEAQHYAQKPHDGCLCKFCNGLVRFDVNYEYGIPSVEAQVRYHEIAKTIKNQGLTRAVNRFPEAYLQISRGMEALDNFYCPVRDFQTEVTLVYGQPGAGKTRYAMLGPHPYKLGVYGEGTDFFSTSYRPREHKTIVVDDFRNNWKFGTFCQVCDRYPTEVQTKGGFRQLLPDHIVFTSNLAPHKWYPNILADPYSSDAFHRRIHNIIFICKYGYKLIKVRLPFCFSANFASSLIIL